MRCMWCHNPESQEETVNKVEKKRILDGEQFLEDITIGTWVSKQEIIDEVSKDAVFYDESGGGVTLSGGEPLMQPKFIESLLKSLKNKGFHTCIDTCGYAESATFKKIMPLADLFLYDIKLIDDVQHVYYTGVSNELTLMNLKLLVQNEKEVIIRFPVIPCVTDNEDNLEAVGYLLKNLGLDRIDLLPYHAMARNKYQRMGMKYQLNEVPEPDNKRLESLKSFFEADGFKVTIGG